jgi:glycosyltransferase involved in cell wall biosynthesis
MPGVLILCEYPTLSGGERSMLATLDGVVRAGFTPAVAAPPQGPLAEALAERGIELVGLAVRDASGGHRPQAAVRQELACLLASRRPSLVHANSLAMGRLAGPVTQNLGIPSLAHLRDILRLSRQAIADLNCHTRLLAVSEAVRRFHTDAGLAVEKTFVLHSGVDLQRFRPGPATGYLHEELGLSPGEKVTGTFCRNGPSGASHKRCLSPFPLPFPLIATIGQIGVRKGLDVLLQAAVRVSRERPDVHYLLVGQRWSDKAESRRFEAELHQWAEARLGGRVHFLGLREDVDRLLREVTMLVHPARQEPLGRVLLEAAASGAAIVATGVGGTCEIFPPDSHAARLVPPDDPERLADAMLELLGDGPLRTRLGDAARRRAMAAFSAEKAAAGLVEHYRQVSSC